MKALVAGLGSIGTRHARNLAASGVQIVGFDPDPQRRAVFAGRLPHAKVCAAFEEAIESGCHLGIVASPSRFHLEQGVRLAEAGLHILIEKPLATETAGVDRLIQATQRRKLVAMVGSNWKFHPMVSKLNALLRDGAIGRALAVQCLGGQYLPDWHPYEDYRQMYSARRSLGGGALLDSHEVDYLTWMLGPAVSLSCRALNTGTLEIETEDVAALLLQFSSGAVGTLQLDYLQRPYGRFVHITGAAGTVRWDAVQNELSLYTAARGSWERWKAPISYDLNQMYVAEIEHFLGCVREGTQPLTPLSQALHVLQILQAAAASSAEGGAPRKVGP